MAGENDVDTGVDDVDVNDDTTGGEHDDADHAGGTDRRSAGGGRDRGQQDGGGQDDKDKTFTQTDVERIVNERLARERKKFAGHDDYKRKASEFDKLQEKNKSDLERVNEQLAAAQVELQRHRVTELRRGAAAKVGLDPELVEFITAVDEEEAEEQAKKLRQRMAPKNGDDGADNGGGDQGSSGRRPDLKQGTRRGPSPQEMTRDDLLRGLAGFRRT